MAIWALADLHLAIGVPAKTMSVFGDNWSDYMIHIERNWRAVVGEDDLVLVAGDISWAINLEEAMPDLNWIHNLPGQKLFLRGNHDYWWSSVSKMTKLLPSSIHFIQNNVFNWKDVSIGGSRLWDTDEYSFSRFINNFTPKQIGKEKALEDQKIFERELQRLTLSLSQLNQEASIRIAMTHYPPISSSLDTSQASSILEKFKVDVCVFGHLHNMDQSRLKFGKARGVDYILTASDYLNFKPIRIL